MPRAACLAGERVHATSWPQNTTESATTDNSPPISIPLRRKAKPHTATRVRDAKGKRVREMLSEGTESHPRP